MWVALARDGGFALALLTFLMWVLRTTLDPIVDYACGGPHSGAASVVQVCGYFNALTLENLTLIAALGVGLSLLGRSVTERKLGA